MKYSFLELNYCERLLLFRPSKWTTHPIVMSIVSRETLEFAKKMNKNNKKIRDKILSIENDDSYDKALIEWDNRT